VINRETSSRTMITFPPFQSVVLLLGVLLALPLLVAFDSDVLHADCSPVYSTDRLMSISYMIINPSALGALSMALVPLLLHIIPILMLMSHRQMYALFISMFFIIAIPTTYSATLHRAASLGLLTAVIGAGWELPITSEYRNAVLMSCGLTVLVRMYHEFVEHIGGTWSFYIGESITGPAAVAKSNPTQNPSPKPKPKSNPVVELIQETSLKLRRHLFHLSVHW
jgi:hypothetical protein